MPFEFLVEDTDSEMYLIAVNDDGQAFILTPEGDEPDFDMLAAYAILSGVEPFILKHFHSIWATVLHSLAEKEVGKLDEFLEKIRDNGKEKKEWVSEGRWEYHDGHYHDVGHYKEYIEELPLEEFAGYIGKAIGYLLAYGHGKPDALDVAKLIKAIRYPDDSEFEFDLEENEPKEEEYNAEVFVWYDRGVFADGEELFEYPVGLKSAIYDPITFESFADEFQEPDYYNMSEFELYEVLKLFGLEREEEKLNRKAIKKLEEPYHPESDEDGEWGVCYTYIEKGKDPSTGHETQTIRETVVPYNSKYEAKSAVKLSNNVILLDDQREELRDKFIDIFIVRLYDGENWERWEEEDEQ